MDGIIVVNKEQGFTSHDVVAKLRGILKTKKIGHTGTLDPMATGVLPVCIGAGTKLCDRMTDTKKIYRARMLLGKDFDTEDITGRLLREREVNVTEEQIKEAAASFVGVGFQLPPMYSAIKIDGKKLYEYARAGKEVERKPREITIFEAVIENIELPFVTMKITCSKGTYIRTLCKDIGEKLGCGGAMAGLERIYTAGFSIEEAHTLEEIEKIRDENSLSKILYPVDSFFRDYPKRTVKNESEKPADNGNMLKAGDFTEDASEPEICVYRGDGLFYGLYKKDDTKNAYVPETLFFCPV